MDKSNKYNLVIVGMGLFEEQPGGANRYMTDFATSLSRKKRNVTVFCPAINDSKYKKENYDFKIVRYKNIEYLNSKIGKLLRFLGKSKNICKQFEENILNLNKDIIVNSHFALNVWPLLKIIKKNSIPLITHFHGPWALESLIEYPDSLYMKIRAKIAMGIEKKVYKQSKYIITLSEAFKKILIDNYDIESKKIVVIPGATQINENILKLSKKEAKKLIGLDENNKHIITVRRLVNRMGLEEFIQASKLLKQKNVNVIIGGKGPLEKKLKELSNDCDAKIEFKGFIPDEQLGVFYRAADLYVLPTKGLEGFGLVTIEALGYGTPVIATNVGGSAEILPKIMPDLLVNCKVEDIGNKMNEFLNGNLKIPDENKMEEFVRNNYSWNNVVEVFEQSIICNM